VKLVLCGPPGVGKTTVAERLARRLRKAGREVRVLHSDDFSRNTYRQMYQRVTETDPDADWILDGTFFEREWQERFLALPDAHLIYLTASLETALERNRTRETSIPESGMRAMHGRFEPPESPDLALDTEQVSTSEAADAIGRYILTWS
jgi:adenylylsulfate kinase